MNKISIDAMFTDHMVLQREVRIPVWGTGPDGAVISVRCGSSSEQTSVIDGKWLIWLPAVPVGGPYQLTVWQDGEVVVQLNDVWVGDVWLAGGQSNMEWKLQDSLDAEIEIQRAENHLIRYYDVPKLAYEDGQERHAEWKICTPEHAPAFSAVAYYFAQKLQHRLQIPIGIIGCNMGATSASCWMDESYLAHDPDLRIYLDEYQDQMKDFDWDLFAVEEKKFMEDFAVYEKKLEQGLSLRETGDPPWPPPLSPHSFMRPNGLYHTMLQKTVPFGIKGFIYYQGENDVPKAHLYRKLLTALIQNWRKAWNDDTLPFLFTQITSYAYDHNSNGEEWPRLREAQWEVSQQVEHTGMAVTIDCGDAEDIHPKDKKPVGQRLAGLALNRVYGQPIIDSGPIYAGCTRQGQRLTITFESRANGLMTRDHAVRGFEVGDDSGNYVHAQAVIKDGNVEVWADSVHEPRAVRYAWRNVTDANLMNSEGLPAVPFRAGEF